MMGSPLLFLFDLDGTLIKFSTVYSNCYAEIIRQTFQHFSIIPDESFIKRIELFGDFEAIINLIGEERADYFWFKVEQADFQLRKQLIEKGEINLMLGGIDVLKGLEKILRDNPPLGIVSNTNPASAFWQMRHFGLLSYFQHMFLLNWNFTIPKPDPGGFLACVKEYGLVGQYRVVYVGDSPSDVDMVKRAKIVHPELQARVILLDEQMNSSKRTRDADYVIGNLTELIPLARDMISTSDFP